jgi:hypothetical protein
MENAKNPNYNFVGFNKMYVCENNMKKHIKKQLSLND